MHIAIMKDQQEVANDTRYDRPTWLLQTTIMESAWRVTYWIMQLSMTLVDLQGHFRYYKTVLMSKIYTKSIATVGLRVTRLLIWLAGRVGLGQKIYKIGRVGSSSPMLKFNFKCLDICILFCISVCTMFQLSCTLCTQYLPCSFQCV